MKKEVVTVIHGPSVWMAGRGWLMARDGDFIVGRFWSLDDAGKSHYDVRMPKLCVKIEEIDVEDP